MKIIFCGSSSFSGYHFLTELNKKKIECHAIFTKKKKFYRFENQKKILNFKFNYINPHVNIKFGSKNFIDIIKTKKINTLCFHHFVVGNLNTKYNLNQNLNKLLKNIDEVIYNLSFNKTPLLIYTSSIYQKISLLKGYKLDESRINYGFAKTIVSNVISYLCKKHKVKFIDFELQNPIGCFEKRSSLPSYTASCFFKKKEIKINNPNRLFEFQFIEKIAKDYYKSIITGKKVNSKYIKSSVKNFKIVFLKNFTKLKNRKKTSSLWKKYYIYYKKLNENKKNQN